MKFPLTFGKNYIKPQRTRIIFHATCQKALKQEKSSTALFHMHTQCGRGKIDAMTGHKIDASFNCFWQFYLAVHMRFMLNLTGWSWLLWLLSTLFISKWASARQVILSLAWLLTFLPMRMTRRLWICQPILSCLTGYCWGYDMFRVCKNGNKNNVLYNSGM